MLLTLLYKVKEQHSDYKLYLTFLPHVCHTEETEKYSATFTVPSYIVVTRIFIICVTGLIRTVACFIAQHSRWTLTDKSRRQSIFCHKYLNVWQDYHSEKRLSGILHITSSLSTWHQLGPQNPEPFYRPQSRGDNTLGSVRVFVGMYVCGCVLIFGMKVDLHLRQHSKWLGVQNGCCFDRFHHRGRSSF